MSDQFCRNLKRARLTEGRSQKDVAEHVGIAKSTYSLYESGKREPDVEKIKLLSTYLNVSTDELLGLDTAKTVLKDDERKLLSKYNRLNDPGQEKLHDRADELIDLGYTKEDRFMPVAAHEEQDPSDEHQKQDDAVMDDVPFWKS